MKRVTISHHFTPFAFGGAKLNVDSSSLGGVPDGSVGRNIFRPARADFEGRKALGRSETRSEIAEIVISDPRKRRHSRGDRVGRSARPDPNPGSRERAGRSVGDDQTTINFAPPNYLIIEGLLGRRGLV